MAKQCMGRKGSYRGARYRAQFQPILIAFKFRSRSTGFCHHQPLIQPGGESLPPISIQIHSTIPVAAGLGSGAAVSVALMRALLAFLGRSLPDRRISALAYEVERLHHGTPSGIDNTVITFERPVYFVKNHIIEPFHAGKPFTIVIGDTGVSALTKESVGDVRRLWESEPAKWNKVFDQIGKIAQEARQVIETDDISPWVG